MQSEDKQTIEQVFYWHVKFESIEIVLQKEKILQQQKGCNAQRFNDTKHKIITLPVRDETYFVVWAQIGMCWM